MANNKPFKIKNGLSAKVYLQSSSALSTTTNSSYYDVTNMVWNSNQDRFNLATKDTGARGFSFSHNGARMYMVGNTTDKVFRYDLSTSYDITTASYVEESSITIDIVPEVAAWNNNGTKFYTLGLIYDDIRSFTASTAYDVTTLSYDGSSSDLYIVAAGTEPKDFHFKSDGTVIYVVASNSTNISYWDLSSAYVPSSGSFGASVSFSSHCSNIYSIDFNAAGTKLILLTRNNSNNNKAVLVFDLGTAWDVSTATLVKDSNGLTTTGGGGDVGGNLSSPYKAKFNADGTKVFIFQYNSYVYQFETTSLAYTETANLNAASYFTLTPSGVTSLAFSNPPPSGSAGSFALEITGTSSYTLEWPSSIKWSGATTPDAPAAGEKDVYTFVTTDGGTTYYGKQAGDAVA
tara:strand:+ start:28 stop:1236 length:1209 start_codon:yes stop_codon:yes gene_type:complete